MLIPVGVPDVSGGVPAAGRPAADAVLDANPAVEAGEEVTLLADFVDDEDEPLTYAWVLNLNTNLAEDAFRAQFASPDSTNRQTQWKFSGGANGTDQITVGVMVSDATTPVIVRRVLSWEANPRDLDSHLDVPANASGNAHHIAYYNRGSNDTDPSRNAAGSYLDVDDVDGHGPETTTIVIPRPGYYLFAIHKYAGNRDLNTSEAVVRVYQSDELKATFRVSDASLRTGADGTPISAESARWWHVCQLRMQDATGRAPDPVHIGLVSDLAPPGVAGGAPPR